MDNIRVSNNNNNIIEKSNTLNTLRNLSVDNSMDLTEFRFFCLYLSKLNARNTENRTVIIPISEFEELFNVSVHTTRFASKMSRISTRQMRIKEDDKLKIINIYSSFAWVDDASCKEIEVTCNYDMLPYIFELKKNYTTYKIANIIHLNSVQKIRLYEICKQYQNMKSIKIDILELQEMMCCKSVEFKFFKRDTLDPAVRDINHYTDITVSYKKSLSCRKVVALEFTICRKDGHTEEPMYIKEPIPVPETTENEINSHRRAEAFCRESPLDILYIKCNQEYTLEQLFTLSDYIENSKVNMSISTENYIYSIYCKVKIEGKDIKNLYRYTFAIIEKQLAEYIFKAHAEQQKTPPKNKPSYDIEEISNMLEVHEVE